ncbi:helix-turn-helix domain-containing protein [Streptomyces pharetrae]|uniref:helix-turn-helix domain-containing protein n=1 Tax=Streptomyces pharetrae TaxID=291370 RepID=UPI00334EFF5B
MSEDFAGDFAALLRELKERSGLSYGVLAKRLHMSTSTLHRYCNGDAVPTDYAPVERLARLCKASPEELVELHRRWVVADAGRGRRPAASEVPPARRREGPAGGGQPDGPVEPVTHGPVEPVTDGRVEPVTDGPTEPVTDGPTEPVSEPKPEVMPGRPAEPLPGPQPEVVSEPSVRSPRRRRAALVAGAAAAVLGVVALVVNLPSGNPGKADAARRGPVGVASPDGGQRPSSMPPTSVPPSASGSPKEKREKKKGGSGLSAGTGASSPSASASATPRPKDGERTTGVPLAVTTRPYTWETPCSQHYLIDSPPESVPPPPTEQDAPAWVASEKAVSAREQLVTLTVQGTGDETVVVESLQVRVVGRDAPLPWNDYTMGVGCGGDVPKRPFSIALDAARPTVEAAAGGRDFPFTVSESDVEVFQIMADASAYDVRWYLELTWTSGSRGGTLRIGDGDQPFRTSGNNGRPAYDFPLGDSGWGPAADEGGE